MLAHVPAYAHESPEKMLVIGGTGGIARELLKHPCCDSIDVYEQDTEIPKIAMHNFDWAKNTLLNTKVEIFSGEIIPFLEQRQSYYDLISVESYGISPITDQFIFQCKKSLKKDGVLSVQGEPFVAAKKYVNAEQEIFAKHFEFSGRYHFAAPLQPGGLACAWAACNEHEVHYPIRRPLGYNAKRYRAYSIPIHKASFAIPLKF